jgi:hypothetical protein
MLFEYLPPNADFAAEVEWNFRTMLPGAIRALTG